MARFLYIVGVEYDEMYYRVPLKKQFCGNLLIRPSSSFLYTVDGDKTSVEMMMVVVFELNCCVIVFFCLFLKHIFIESKITIYCVLRYFWTKLYYLAKYLFKVLNEAKIFNEATV